MSKLIQGLYLTCLVVAVLAMIFFGYEPSKLVIGFIIGSAFLDGLQLYKEGRF